MENVELVYETWGSYGQFVKTTAVLKNGKLLDPAELPLKKGDKNVEIDIFGIKIVVNDESSRKNRKIHVFVPKNAVIAIISESATSGGWKGFKLNGPGEIVAEIAENVTENGNKRIIKRIKTYYYQNNAINVKIPLKSENVSVQTELISKPQIVVNKLSDRILITGDTYQIREKLKALGFKWDALKKAWYTENSDEKVQVLEKLNEVADVKM